METCDPPCDFDAFVAQQRGIGDDEARQLIRHWLASYVPRAKLADAQPESGHSLEHRQAG